MATVTKLFPFFTLLVLTITTGASAHNITAILEKAGGYDKFNSYLTQTKLADDINAKQTVTVCALNDGAMSSLTSKPLSTIKALLSLHILFDYFDNTKLHSLKNGAVQVTSLYQNSGPTISGLGMVNITDAKGGVVAFKSAQPGSKPGPTYVKEIKTLPYNLSVIEISEPIIAPALLTEATPDANVTAILEKAGCKTFGALIASSGVLKVYQTQMDKGITIFAPNDDAFKAKGVPDLSKLSNAELVSLLQYHALNTYAPVGTLKTSTGPLQTLAAGAGKYSLTATAAGDAVTLHTGVDSSRVANTLLDSTPVVIYSVDSVLLPVELFGLSPAPAPAPVSDTPAPAPAPKAKAPAPATSPAASPPAPPMDTPAGAPASDAPGKAADEHSKNGVEGRFPALFFVVACGVVSMIL